MGHYLARPSFCFAADISVVSRGDETEHLRKSKASRSRGPAGVPCLTKRQPKSTTNLSGGCVKRTKTRNFKRKENRPAAAVEAQSKSESKSFLMTNEESDNSDKECMKAFDVIDV